MTGVIRILSIVFVAALFLSGCATARLHSASEVNSVGERCGLTFGELFQDESEKRLLFLMKPGATAEQRACVVAWARKNKLKTVFVSVQFPEG